MFAGLGSLWVALTVAVFVMVPGCTGVTTTVTVAEALRPATPAIGFVATLLVSPILWVGIIAAFQLYLPARLSPSEEFRRLVEALAVIVGIKLILPFDAAREATRFPTGGWLAVAWSLTIVFLLFEREIWHKYMWRLRTRGRLSYRTVIVGTNSEAVRIARTLKSKTFGYRPLGFVQTGGEQLGDPGRCGASARHRRRSREIVGQHGVECMFVAPRLWTRTS